ncbi:MAG: polymer-forming cytoskeletal protein [Phycisphaerales bacterium]|nr:MAG: polymer-forming cytoskeletal protein [Phycisphaerales bacterium]
MPLITKQRQASSRQVVCPHCGHRSEASSRAMSVFCPHCHKRVILEDYKIKGYYGVHDFATCGDIVVERGGYVAAPIKVGNLTVKGKVQGNVIARGAITIEKKGLLTGDIEAPSLLVKQGGALTGFVRIGPLPVAPTA